MTTIGRVWFWVTAVAVLAGIVIQLIATARGTDGYFSETPERVLNVFAYFTIQSNILLGATVLLDPRSTLVKTLRLNGVLCIAVTGIVYHLVLAGLSDLSALASVANLLLHTVTPILGVLGWVLFGPRGRTDVRIAAWSLAFPLLWLAFTLVRGEFVGFYPYPFVDVSELGYGQVILNCLLVAVLFLALAAGATALDRRLRKTVEG